MAESTELRSLLESLSILDTGISLKPARDWRHCFEHSNQYSYALDADGHIVALNLRAYPGGIATVWPLFEALPKLMALNLSYLALNNDVAQQLEFKKDTFKSLEYLHLNNGRIESLAIESQLPKLKRLDAQQSHLERLILSELPPFPVLEYLDISGNAFGYNLSEVDVAKLVASDKLRFAHFKIVGEGKVEDERNYQNLGNIFTDLNDLKSVKAVAKDILFAYQQKALVDNKTLKINIIGWGEAGKTSLLDRLIERTFKNIKKEERTHGIVVRRWSLRIEDEAFDVRFWDYGGQDYYHGTHQMFLHKNNVYLILWYPNPEKEHENYAYWLGAVAHFAKGEYAPIFLVQSRMDEFPHKHLFDSEKLKYYKISADNIHYLSAKEADNQDFALGTGKHWRNFEIFEKDLQLFIADNPITQGRIPLYYQSIREAIFNDTTHQLPISCSLSDFKNIFATALQDQSDELKGLLEYLHLAGAAVQFEDIAQYQDAIFLNPPRLASQIYDILDKKHLLKTDGELKEETIKSALLKTYPAEKIDDILKLYIELMLHFKLIFEPKQADKNKGRLFIAPQYLPEQSSGSLLPFLEETMPISFVLYFEDYLHLGTVFSMIATFGNLAEHQNFWRYGVVFKLFGLQVLAYADADKRLIRFRIQEGPQKFKVGKYLFHCITTNSFPEQVPAEYPEQTTFKTQMPSGLAISTDGLHFAYVDKIAQQLKNRQTKVDSFILKTEDNKLIKTSEHVFQAFNAWHHFIFGDKTQNPKKVFLSYSHKDEAYRERLEIHLSMLKREGHIDAWHDRKIQAGDDWNQQIEENLRQADVIIFMLSPDFLASDYIWNKELKIAQERLKRKEAVTLVPILLRHCDTTNLELLEKQRLPPTYSDSLKWVADYPNPDVAYLEIVKGLRAILTT
jgi:internalin A